MSDKQLRKEIDIDIPFRDEHGADGMKKVHVNFVSTRIQRMYATMMGKVYDIIHISEEIKKVTSEMGTVLVDKYDISLNEGDGTVIKEKVSLKERKNRMKALQEKYDEYERQLQDYDKHFFDEKFDIIYTILTKNGVTDPELLDRDWWMDCVDMHDVMAFIEAACTKDDELVDQKKKEWSR